MNCICYSITADQDVSPLIASNLYIFEVHACNEERFDIQSCFKSTARGAAADSRTESGGPGSGFSVT